MAGATYVLDKTYTETDAAGVGQYLAVIRDTADTTGASCKLPTAAAQKIVGITQEEQPNQKGNVVVRKLGISRATAAGAIAADSYVEVAGTSGKLQAVTPLASGATLNSVVGIAESPASADGDVFFVFLTPGSIGITA